MLTRLTSIILILITTSSCISYSPYEVDVDEGYKDMNRKNLNVLLGNQEKDDTVTFAFIGDTQRFYDESNYFVQRVNADTSIEFVVISGDISDFGLNLEFHEMVQIFNRLHVPYVTVIGNHDMLYNGEKIYNQMFGDQNYSFIYNDFKFVMLNTNSREFEFNGHVPDINWLDNELSDTAKYTNAIIVSHIAPYSGDFDPNLEIPYTETLVKWEKTLLSMNGHEHDFAFNYPYPGGVAYLNSFSTGKGKYLIVKIWKDGFDFEIKDI